MYEVAAAAAVNIHILYTVDTYLYVCDFIQSFDEFYIFSVSQSAEQDG